MKKNPPPNAFALARLLIALAPCLEAQTYVSPGTVQFETTADSLVVLNGYTGGVGVTPPPDSGWRYLGAQNGLDFIVVSPSQGSAASVAIIGLNPSVFPYLRPGNYMVTAMFGQSPPSGPGGGAFVFLKVDPPPPPSVTSVVSAASLQPQISPGELISIFGANIGTPPISAQYNGAGLYPTTLGNTTVTIDGTLAPLLFVSTTQINAVVPFEVAGQKSVDVVVTHDDVAAPTVSIPIVDTSPAIFTITGTGKGQGAILNATSGASTPNSAGNPAPANSIVSIYATGGGLLTPSYPQFPATVQDGSVVLEAAYAAAAPISVTIGGQPARINYAGCASYEVAGMLQINAFIPQGIGSGAQPVVLKIGNNDNSAQQVTVAVK